MSRPFRIIVAFLLLAIAVIGTAGVATQIETTYFLPPGSTGMATKHTELFVPAVVGTIAGLLVTVGAAVHLIVAVRRRLPRWTWVTTGTLALLVVCVPFVVAGMDRPDF